MNQLIAIAARIVLGLIYFVFGWMGLLTFLGVLPMPSQPMSPGAEGFFKGIMGAVYFFPLLKGTEIIGGFLLVLGLMPRLALVVLAPITLNIALFHAFLTPGAQNQILSVAMVVLHVVAASAYMKQYSRLFAND